MSAWEKEMDVDKNIKTDHADEIAVKTNSGDDPKTFGSSKNNGDDEVLKVVTENS